MKIVRDRSGLGEPHLGVLVVFRETSGGICQVHLVAQGGAIAGRFGCHQLLVEQRDGRIRVRHAGGRMLANLRESARRVSDFRLVPFGRLCERLLRVGKPGLQCGPRLLGAMLRVGQRHGENRDLLPEFVGRSVLASQLRVELGLTLGDSLLPGLLRREDTLLGTSQRRIGVGQALFQPGAMLTGRGDLFQQCRLACCRVVRRSLGVQRALIERLVRRVDRHLHAALEKIPRAGHVRDGRGELRLLLRKSIVKYRSLDMARAVRLAERLPRVRQLRLETLTLDTFRVQRRLEVSQTLAGLLLQRLSRRGGSRESCGKTGFALRVFARGSDGIGETILPCLLEGTDGFGEPPLGQLASLFCSRQLVSEVLALGAITPLGLEQRSVGDQPMQTKVKGAERGARPEDVIAGAVAERVGRQGLVPFGNHNGRNLERSRGDVLQDRERVHAAGAMLDEQNVEGNIVCISSMGRKVQPSVWARDGGGDFDGTAGSAKALARERRVSNVQTVGYDAVAMAARC